MGSKVLRKLSAQLQGAETYASDAMLQIPFSDGVFNQGFDPIEDDSILGSGFADSPQQGLRHVGGSYTLNVDKTSIVPFLSAAMGGVSSGNYYFDLATLRKLSICELNSVNAIKYTSCYLKSLKLSGTKGSLLKADIDVFSLCEQDRQAIAEFPSVTVPGIPYNFQELGGASGYFRVGDHTDALAAGDDMQIESFNIELNTGLDESFANENNLTEATQKSAIGSLYPLWGMTRPTVKFSFKLPRFSAETFLTWQENDTRLQAILNFNKGSDSSIQIQIPNFKVKADLSSDDITGIDVEAMIGHNGVGTSYINDNMEFVSPIYITIGAAA